MGHFAAWPTGLAARSLALERLAEAAGAADRPRASADDEALHDFRVAVRRLRVVLGAYRRWLRDTVSAKRRRRLKALASATGAPRDLQVQVAWLERHTPSSEPAAGAARDLLRRLGGIHPAPADLRKALRAFDREKRPLAAELRTWTVPRFGDAADPPFSHATAERAGEQLDALREGLGGMGTCRHRESIHAARLSAKKLRYLLEPFARIVPDCAAACKRLARLQDGLGDLNDLCLLNRRVTDAGNEADDALAPGYAALARCLHRHRKRRFATIRKEWSGSGPALDAVTGAVRALATAAQPGRAAPRRVPNGRTRVDRDPRHRSQRGLLALRQERQPQWRSRNEGLLAL